MTEEERALAEALQDEMWVYAEAVMKERPNMEYRDVLTVFLLWKIAQLQLKVLELSNK